MRLIELYVDGIVVARFSVDAGTVRREPVEGSTPEPEPWHLQRRVGERRFNSPTGELSPFMRRTEHPFGRRGTDPRDHDRRKASHIARPRRLIPHGRRMKNEPVRTNRRNAPLREHVGRRSWSDGRRNGDTPPKDRRVGLLASRRVSTFGRRTHEWLLPASLNRRTAYRRVNFQLPGGRRRT